MTEPHTFRPGTLDADGLLIRDPRYLDAVRQGTRGLKDAEALRDLVLKHPDLADRLTAWPVSHTTPQIWNGYIPPLMTCAEGGVHNASPRRAALIEICADAMERDYGPEATATWKWTLG
jgi:hypothetical protein